jgi:hypothetical protein
MQDIGIFYGHLVYFTTIWCILWPFGVFLIIWYIVSREKSGNPDSDWQKRTFAKILRRKPPPLSYFNLVEALSARELFFISRNFFRA